MFDQNFYDDILRGMTENNNEVKPTRKEENTFKHYIYEKKSLVCC